MPTSPRSLLLALALVAASGCAAASGSATAPGPATGSTASDFALDTLDGARFQLSEHLGKEVVVIAFWATWCEPCKAEMPHLAALHRKYRDKGLLVLGVSIDGPESLAQVRGDVAQGRVPYPVLLDAESRVVASYNPRRSAPFSVVIDRKGRIVHQHDGYTAGDEVALEREIVAELGP